MTQDELLPYILEEKKRKQEERTKQRELDEEMRRKAREDSQKLNEEVTRNAEQRKVMFEEERRKLEHQTSLAQEGQEKKKAPLSRSEAGRIIEQELEEQRIREQLTRIEMEKIKEKERIELEKQKLKRVKKEEHPAAFHKDLIQTPIFDEKGDTVVGGDFQGLRLSTKRGSVIDLIDGDGTVERTERPVENRPAPEPVIKPPQPPNQLPSQPQVQPHYQPVIRRAKEGGKSAANRNLENRKSIVELEIERQREREEEARREAELARRAHSKHQGDDQSIENKSEENKPKEHHPKKADVAMRPPSVHKRTEKFEKKSEGYKAKEHRPKQAVERNNVAGKNPGLQTQVEIEPAVEEKNEMAVASSLPIDGVDGKHSIENGGESQAKEFETEEERKRREEKEYFRQMQEEEKRRRESQKQDLERIRKEVDRKEAEELMRLKLEKEEGKTKQREIERLLAEERQKDNTENQKKIQQDAATRKTAFAAHKLILEQRVLKALEETKQENTLPKRRASSFDRATDYPGQDDTVSEENVEELSSGGVKLRKANFENSGARKELRKNRFSLNLDNIRRGLNQPEHAPLRNVHPGSLKERTPYAADDAFIKESQAQENAVTWRSAGSNESNLSKAKSLGDLSQRKGGRNDDLSAHPVLRKVSFSNDQTDSVDGRPTFSDSRIQQELEEQRMREEILKQEAIEREKRYRLEEEKRKTVEQPTSKKEMSLSDIKRNPLPNKIQVIFFFKNECGAHQEIILTRFLAIGIGHVIPRLRVCMFHARMLSFYRRLSLSLSADEYILLL